MNVFLWVIWGIGVAGMASGVGLVSSRRPRSHHVWGFYLFAAGFVVSIAAIATLLVVGVG